MTPRARAIAPDSGIHDTLVNTWLIVKHIKGCDQELLVLATDSGVHDTSTHWVRVNQVSTL